jgi:broad specificity phosphatase PhoE
MKVLFIRHGEAMDDIFDAYGGWADDALSDKGCRQAKQAGKVLAKKGFSDWDMVLYSPLKRAAQTAKILADELGLKTKKFVYLKERNTYGLLCGLNKQSAKIEYPELVEAYKAGKFVLGSERYEDFLKRVKTLLSGLSKLNFDKIICVTHGKLMKAILKDVLDYPLKKIGDLGYFVISLSPQGKLELLETNSEIIKND